MSPVQIDNSSPDHQLVWTLEVDDQHPAVHGPMRLDLAVTGDQDDPVITHAEPLIVPLHRGVEKLFESRDYRQALMLADRHDWHSAFSSELGLALTIEAMAGIAVPRRATWIRTAMAELNRAIHHLRWLGETIGEIAQTDPVALGLRDQCRQAKESLVWLHEAISGGRLHPMLVVPGGVRDDAPVGWSEQLRDAARDLGPLAQRLVEWVSTDERLRGVAVLPPTSAIDFAVSGPVARASGMDLDLRFDDPYLAYPDLIDAGLLVRVTRTAGDAQARLQVLAEELAVSLRCIGAAASELGSPGDQEAVNVRLPRSLRIPEGSGYGWTENPTGINGWFLVSRGGPMPYRLKLRTASFANAQALCQILKGTRVSQLPLALMTFLIVAGDLGK